MFLFFQFIEISCKFSQLSIFLLFVFQILEPWCKPVSITNIAFSSPPPSLKWPMEKQTQMTKNAKTKTRTKFVDGRVCSWKSIERKVYNHSLKNHFLRKRPWFQWEFHKKLSIYKLQTTLFCPNSSVITQPFPNQMYFYFLLWSGDFSQKNFFAPKETYLAPCINFSKCDILKQVESYSLLYTCYKMYLRRAVYFCSILDKNRYPACGFIF